MEVDGGQLLELLRRPEELGVRVLVGVQRRGAERLVDRRHHLDVVLEEARAVVEHLVLAVERVAHPGVRLAEGDRVDEVGDVERVAPLEDRHQHVVVRLLQRKVEVARHLVHQQVALDVAALAHVLAQLGDAATAAATAAPIAAPEVRTNVNTALKCI